LTGGSSRSSSSTYTGINLNDEPEVSPREKRKTAAPVAKPLDTEQSRRRVMAKSMYIASDIDNFMGNMLDVMRRGTLQEEDD